MRNDTIEKKRLTRFFLLLVHSLVLCALTLSVFSTLQAQSSSQRRQTSETSTQQDLLVDKEQSQSKVQDSDKNTGNATSIEPAWSQNEITQLQSFSFEQIPDLIADPSNRYQFHPGAIKFGKRLFHDPLLSRNHKIACATCHQKGNWFTDGKRVSEGLETGKRNTPSILGVVAQTWFFWDGRADSLWAQAIESLESPSEHGLSRVALLRTIANHPEYQKRYERVFGKLLPDQKVIAQLPEQASPNGTEEERKAWHRLSKEQQQEANWVAANIGKSIAAYVATLRHRPSRFDRFVSELKLSGQSALLSESEQKGLRLFMSQKTGCTNCHFGALFSNQSFHSIGTGNPAGDNGRADSIDRLMGSEFNCLGKYSDAPREACDELAFSLTDKVALAGLFKTPGLRNVSHTAPYMHDGRFSTLASVVAYYAGFDNPNTTLHADLPVIRLTREEQNDLVDFLGTL